jgi:hypothetical protein
MRENKEKKRARLLAKASQVIDEYLAWEDKNPRPDMMQIEEIALKLRKEFGQEIAQLAIENQEAGTPAPGPRCTKCGQEMRYKGKKRTDVESRTGRLRIGEVTTTVRSARRAFFPLDRQLRLQDRNWSEGVAEAAPN